MQFLWILILALFLCGCQAKQPESSETQGASAPGQQANFLKGKVLERLDASRYSYLRLSTADGEIWAAVPQTDVKPGAEVTIQYPMPMANFEAKSLNRTFDSIMFGTLQPLEDAEKEQVLQDVHSGVSEPVNAGPIKVEKAAGPEGRTIAEIFSQKGQLKDRNVAVRGKVVKVNPSVMGKTWIHIQDGTGNAQAKTNDLTVTSQSNASVGDTVVVKGVVRTDKDFGMGYFFPVIVEDATITK